MRWFWGLLIIVVGLIILGTNLSRWSHSPENFQFWPLIVILFGITLIFRRWNWGWIVILITFLAATTLVFYMLLSGSIPTKMSKIKKQEIITTNFSEVLPAGVKKAKIVIKAGAAAVKISSTDKLFEGTTETLVKPKLDLDSKNEEATLTFSTNNNNNIYFWRNAKNSLDLKISNQIPVELILDAGASKLDLDFSSITLNSLDINAGASTIDLTLGKISNIAEFTIDAGASKIDIRLPKNLGMKIETKTGISTRNFNGFTQINKDIFQNESYINASQKINLVIKSGASTITINQF